MDKLFWGAVIALAMFAWHSTKTDSPVGAVGDQAPGAPTSVVQ